MSQISDKIEELISLKRIKGCEYDGFSDWLFKVGKFRFEKFKNTKNKHQSYLIFFCNFFSDEEIYREFQKPCGYSSIRFFLDKEKMSIVIKKTLDKEIEKETKILRKKEEKIFRNCGNIDIFKRVFNFILNIK